ncbi:MAG: HAMP domain-containing sensor histidine kinase [Anaerolineae bacterium]
MFSSLRAQLLAAFLVIILITLASTVISFALMLRPYQTRLVQAQLRATLTLASPLVQRLLESDLSLREAAEILQRERTNGARARILLLTPQGEILADSSGDLAGTRVDPERIGNWRSAGTLVGTFEVAGEGELQFVARPLRRPDNRSVLILAAVAPTRPFTQWLELWPLLLYTLLIAIVVSSVLSILIVRSVTRPVSAIAAAAEQVARGQLEQQLAIKRPSELRRLVESFNAMTRQVRHTQRSQRDFIANVSHDLKTPLTSIQGYAQALIDGTARTPEARQRAAQIIYDEAQRMHQLVEQLLELARLDAGQVQMRQETFDLRQLVTACVERQSLRIQRKQITLDIDLPEPLVIVGDPSRLEQVVTNLVDNALSYTPDGGRVIVAGTRSIEGARQWVSLSITDTGPGIAAEDLPHIFDRFYRVDKARERGKGFGLGLAIVKELVEAHGGSIEAESVVGLGTRFTVQLPSAPTAPTSQTTDPRRS